MKIEEFKLEEIIEIVNKNNLRVTIQSCDDGYKMTIEPINTFSYVTPVSTANDLKIRTR